MTLSAANKTAWINALNSPSYVQVRGGWVGRTANPPPGNGYDALQILSCVVFGRQKSHPYKLEDITDGTGLAQPLAYQVSLYNDFMTFAQVATWIQANV
jgi:hypothetical protein